MTLNWTALTSDQLAAEASCHLNDHDDGSSDFFDVALATWSLVSIVWLFQWSEKRLF